MLKDILNNQQCFKLVCGAGNEDTTEIEKLVALYAKAGVRFFDLSAKEDIVRAAVNGLRRVVSENELQNYHLCVSVGIKDDPHFKKASIDRIMCTSCGKCKEVCNQEAIWANKNDYSINTIRCIGCEDCLSECMFGAISIYSQDKLLNNILPPIIDLGIDCIEFHASGKNEDEIYTKWATINNNFNGILSICIDRFHFGDDKLIKCTKKLIENRQDYTTIIQIGGIPISGNDDNYGTTLQAVAAAQIIQNANLPVFILLSGGTNSKSTELAKLCGIKVHGIAVGSYARKIVQKYTKKEDFFENTDIFNTAVDIAKNLVDKSLMYLK